MFHKLLTGAVLALCMLGGALSAHAENIRLAVTDLVGLEELQREFGPFKSELERVSGLGIDFLPVTNRTAALEALRFKKVDFVLAGPAEYVVMQKRANASVVAGLYRPDYYSLIVVKADSPIFSVRELKGKRVGMGPVGSTSRHLGPIQLLADSGLDPLKDTGITNTNLRLAWEGLKKGDLEAVGMGRSDLENFLSKEAQEQRNAYRILVRGGDLPNDLLMAGEHVPARTIEKLRTAIVDNSEALVASIGQGAEHVKRYQGMRFLTTIADKDYDIVRSMYRTAGYPEYSEFIGD
ncbi:Phosphonate ABC transporter, periplasmic phosphate-binding protein [Azotobacter vinelandii CA]|uniref:Phosphonate ABC transporter, periplasmic phosphate-binding protein n=3 Tax=Azotobacter group TaxID=351 RepID=C1DSL1_AZOVD|nr:PhnD/SsuA/transferrin family substrate-binding protein [Azotobacter vinelandii]ACO77966.1 Phosphonate ABC transporter, periplasmic phosphate-binding protein [Azotobacter vinelandii DJ]AGK16915.1 Phosphonate ABC transporter, periplasmic phosphate-binding protein [Azotobacter vinelandii CA]AGK20130.1 Phosphonate ABC transporter, periplasmic phosphate-binding protein [Azotobacter vinelandii CA6]SFY21407.1 phosphonate transport system substrate-binding protein [Azotobacter vinelandii]GLK60482.1